LNIWNRILRFADWLHAEVKRQGGINDPTGILISLAISLAISAISYGLQVLLAPNPPKVSGPQKDDLSSPVSKPGQPIPFAVGRNLARAQCIWTTGLVETKHVEKVKGGKGGGKTQKVESFTYSISMALAFNDGEIECLIRVLANGGKLLYSNRLSAELSESEIDAQVQAKYDEVYATDYAYWTSLVDSDGNRLYTDSQANQTADTNATTESEQLRTELESANADTKTRYTELEIYYGTEDQEPSPIIESFEGAGNVPAFKGVAYIVFRDLQLADFGNSVPLIEIDYGTAAGGGNAIGNDGIYEVGTAIDGSPLDITQGVADDNWAIDFTERKAYITNFPASGRSILEYDIDTLEYVQNHKDALAGLNGSAFIEAIDQVTGYLVLRWWGFTTAVEDTVYDPATGTIIAYAASRDQAAASNFSTQTGTKAHHILYSPDGGVARIVSIRTTDGTIAFHDFPALTAIGKTAGGGTSNAYSGFVQGEPGVCWGLRMTSFTNQFLYLTKCTVDNLGNAAVSEQFETIDSATVLGSGGTFSIAGNLHLFPVAVDSFVIVVDQNGYGDFPTSRSVIFRWTIGATEPDWVIDVPISGTSEQYPILANSQDGPLCRWRYDESTGLGTIFLPTNTNQTEIWKIDPADGTYEIQDQGRGHDIDAFIWDDIEGCLYEWAGTESEPETSLALERTCYSGVCGVDPVTLYHVIESYLQKAGYTSAEYDIDAGLQTETIYGFNNNGGRSVREVLEDLARIRPVSAFESERKLKFKLQDSTSRVTVPLADIRAYDANSNAPEWINEVTTLEDLNLPQSLQINYQDQDLLLNTVPVFFKREVAQSITRQEFSVEAVDTADNMRRSIFNAMSQMLVTKRTFKFTLPQKYVGLEPGDRLTVPVSDTRSADVRITKTERGANGIVELTCVAFVNFDLQVTVPDDYTYIDPDTADVLLASRFYFIDIPYLTDSAEEDDDGNEDRGIYVAVANNGNPAGANLYVDNNDVNLVSDGGSPPTYSQLTGDPEWILVATFDSFVDDGVYVRGLSNSANPYVVDTTSEFIVSFRNPDASFSSISDNAILTSQDNVFLIGNEILQAQTAELIGTSPGGLKTYQFTNLYRGLQGTEWAIIESGGPGTGADVVHLNPNALQRVDFGDINLVGKTITARAVTVGQEIADTDNSDNVYYGRSRLPYAPNIDSVSRDGSGNLTFNLISRNRYGDDWSEGGSPTFKSDPDEYEIDIIDNSGSPGTVVRTLTASGDPDPTITYTAAQQVTDFGSTQASVAVRPYQLNADGNRGFTNEEAI